MKEKFIIIIALIISGMIIGTIAEKPEKTFEERKQEEYFKCIGKARDNQNVELFKACENLNK